MSHEVYANNRAISGKSADGKSIAAFPDVCLSPPSPPAGPVPIPYPNTGFASDTANGSRTVKLKGQEVILKDKSYFSKSTGDEAATRALGMGVVTHTITGKVYFTSWSMDVKIEGENVVRHLDLTTHNHMSQGPNTPPWAHADKGAFATSEDCAGDRDRIKDSCTGDKAQDCADEGTDREGKKFKGLKNNPCVKAKRCQLVPYKPRSGCCPGQTAHHLVPKRAFKGNPKYDEKRAPCVCAEGFSWHRNDKSPFPAVEKTHPDLHDIQDYLEREARDAPAEGRDPNNAMTYSEIRDTGIAAHKAAFPDSGCEPKCLKAQLDAFHGDEVGASPSDPVRTPGGLRSLDQIAETSRDPSQLARARQHLATFQAAAARVAKVTVGAPS